MNIIYHSRDLDGWCSAAILFKKFYNAKLYPYDYGDKFDFKILQDNFPTIIVDICFDMPIMLEIARLSRWNLTWIDHHISAIKKYYDYTKNSETFMHTVLNDKLAACELTYKFCYQKEAIPASVLWLGMYDSWRNNDKQLWDNYIMPFQYGMRAICNSPETFPAYFLENTDYAEKKAFEILQYGKWVIKYQDLINITRCKYAYEITFENYKAICLNSTIINSQVFESIWDDTKYDIMIAYNFSGTNWTVSLYTTKPDIDVSELARKYGGGGHCGAAGFQLQNIDLIMPL